MEREIRGHVQPPRKFGVVADDFAGLAGAADFIVSFVDGMVRAAGERQVVLILRTPARLRSPIAIARRLRAWLRGHSSGGYPDWRDQIEWLRGAGLADLPVLLCERSERALARLCKREGIDAIGPLTNPPWGRFPIPWVGYLFDFQHRHLPHFFTSGVIADRDRMFRRMLAKADAIVVNACDVKNDIESCFPGMGQRVFVLPFSAAPKEEWFATDPATVREQYGIGLRYFLVSNQFWIHKRHEVAIEAFARATALHGEIELVLTGDTRDWRAPTRREDIEALIRKLGLAGRVHILGLIPKLDQIAIMRGAVAVVQPTAFEGGPGGGSVFDAVALGVPSIVSDIPVNREIKDLVTVYFALDDVDALAAAMRRMLSQERALVDSSLLLRAGAARRVRMGRVAWEAVEAACFQSFGSTMLPTPFNSQATGASIMAHAKEQK